MEPCAPGTEDDPPIMFSTLNKQANEQERLLKQKAVLKNGQYGNIFELSYVAGAEHWFCNACQCPVMGRVYQHEIGKRHTSNLAMTNRPVEKQEKDEETEEPIVIDIAPGEPIPPGFEGEIGRVSQIQERLDGFNVGPLIALEYLLELQDYDPSKEPYYLCILCDKKGDPRTVLTHLASYNHISQYLQKHFPTCYRALAPYMTKQYKRNWQTTLQKVAEAIEKKFGRLKPYPIEKDKFEKERLHYLQMICRGRHFSENSGWTFEELIVHDELTKTYEDEKPYEITPPVNWGGSAFIQKPFKKRSPSPPVVACPSSKRVRGNAQTNPKKPIIPQAEQTHVNHLPLNVNYHHLEEVTDRCHGKTPNYQRQRNEFTEKKITEKEREKIRKLEEFRKLGRAIENDMHKTLKQHEKNPEKHPQYNEEWKKFWNKRYKELQATGVDVSKHDFKPEWIEFWNKRMIEIHSDELRSRKDALRKRLGLPEEPNPIKFTIGAPPPGASKDFSKENKPNLPMAAQPDQDNEVIIIDDKDDDINSLNRSHSPWEDESLHKSRPNRKRSISPGRIHKRSTVVRSRSQDESPPRVERSNGSNKMDRPVRRSKSRERVMARRSRSKERSHSRDIVRSKDYRDSRDRRSYSRERRSRSRERSWERRDLEKRMDYRESSYERDLRGRERVRTVADLPWEREKAFRHQFEEYYKPPPIMRDVTRKPVLRADGGMIPVVVPPEEDDDGEVNIVDVLRILTALEERLGSLGPKIIDLLAQALALEKNEANSSETLLDNDINCVLFETVKEKLKGQLLAGLVDILQERAFKKAIKKIATLIHMAGQRKRQRERMMPKIKPVTVPGVGTVDKAAIAKQIATALIMQGKTDVTQAELEQLINAVLAGGTISFDTLKSVKEEKEPEEKIIIPTSFKKTEVVDLEKLTEPLTPSPGKSSVNNMENLSDSDLQTLLQNFKDLSTDEQHNLINYLKKLETHEPERVERLRKFVNLDPGAKIKTEDGEESNENKDKSAIGRESPFSNRLGSTNPAVEELVKIESEEEDAREEKQENKKTEEKEKPAGKPHLDSEDEDYSYEDVVKAVSKTVKDKELENNMKLVEDSMKFETNKAKNELNLSDAKALISNLMSNISKSSSGGSSSIDLLGLRVSSANPSTSTSSILTSTADFAKTFSNINVDNLASIVSNVKRQTAESNEKLNFEPPVRTNVGKLNFDPSQLNKPESPNLMMDINDNLGLNRSLEERPIGPGPGMGPAGPLRGLPRIGMDLGDLDMGYNGPGGLNRDNRGPFGPSSRDMGLGGREMGPGGREMGLGGRDMLLGSRDIGPNMGLSGPGFGPRDRPVVQYPRNPVPYGSNYGNDFTHQQTTQYLNTRGARPGPLDQRNRFDDDPRIGGGLGNPFNRPGRGDYNRW
ncbi:hypothetical protein NQ314_008784 [Rhamnusium bicolor]|uniref:U1-type domain-containing protein n=1 Tax=Rhamnusium bicolor TaxID=1586634 RepID=A0AAV8Y7R9_9CUCU|nr:hypothetical protein NQ314_008784 [Rhamnusium bicolor]